MIYWELISWEDTKNNCTHTHSLFVFLDELDILRLLLHLMQALKQSPERLLIDLCKVHCLGVLHHAVFPVRRKRGGERRRGEGRGGERREGKGGKGGEGRGREGRGGEGGDGGRGGSKRIQIYQCHSILVGMESTIQFNSVSRTYHSLICSSILCCNVSREKGSRDVR